MHSTNASEAKPASNAFCRHELPFWWETLETTPSRTSRFLGGPAGRRCSALNTSERAISTATAPIEEVESPAKTTTMVILQSVAALGLGLGLMILALIGRLIVATITHVMETGDDGASRRSRTHAAEVPHHDTHENRAHDGR